MATLLARGQITIAAIKDGKDGADGKDAVIYTLEASPSYIRLNSDGSIDYTNGYIDKGDEYESDKYLVVRGYKVAKGVRDNRFSTEANPITLRLTINDGSAYHEYTPSDGDSVSIDFEPKYEDSYYSMLQEISNSGLNSVRVDMCEGSEYNTNKILATCDIPIIRNGKDGQKGDQGDKGEQGNKGDKGEDAVSVLVENAPLVFDTNDDGIVSPDISKLAKVKIMRGNRNVSDECSDVYSMDDMCVNCKCGVMQENGYISVSILGNNITKNDVIVNGVIQGKVSATSGYAVAQVAYDGVTYFVQVPFSVNVAKFTSVVAFNNKQYESKFSLITKRLDNTPTNNDLTKAEARITQTAREISLSVSEKAMGRRNLLVGSAARRQGEGWTFMSGDYYNGLPCESIEINSGHEGVNAIHCRTKQTSNSYYNSGFHWIGTFSSQGNIKIEKGKSYTLSFWAKASNSDYVYFVSELIWQGSATDNSRPAGYAGPKGFFKTQHATKNNTWTLFKVNIEVPSDASYEYVEVNIFARAENYTLQDAYICKPMLEEGDYNGWTLSEQDYDYIGGNLLDNTRTLTVGGNLDYVDANTIISQGFGYDSAVAHVDNSSGSSYKEILLWETTSGDNISFQKGNDYLLSFLASGSGKMTCYLFCNVNNTSSIYSENNQGDVMNNSIDGHSNFTLSSGWKRYWVHFRVLTDSPLPTTILMRASIGTNVYIAQPKLEEGAVVTEYTERKSDLVDKATLKKAGIEVKSDEVILYGDKIRVDNNGQTAAMFIGGKLNAAFIDADKIEVKHLWAKSNDGASKVGYFGNTEEEACKIDDTYAPLFVGADTAKNSPFYVTNKGHMVSKSATLGSFSLNESSLRYLTGYDDEEPGFALYNEYMVFRGYSRTFSPQTQKWTSERNRLIWVGRNDWVYSVPSLMSNILVQDSFPMTTGDTAKIGLHISVTGCDDKYQYEDVNYNGAMGSNVYGNFAIYAENGMYAGFRPMTRMANYSMKLTKLDCVIYVSVTGITLTLPDNPQRGQCYKFIQGAGSFHIKSSSKNIYSMHVGQTDNFTSDSYNQITEIIWIGDHWRINWFRESVGK